MRIIAGWIIILIMLQLIAAAQTRHNHYVTYYNHDKMEPDSVVYNLTPDMVNCMEKPPKRKDKFARDPLIINCAGPDDYGSIDRGHLFSYADAECNSTDRIECFYMSNMLPQYHGLNAGDWKKLETKEREWAKRLNLHILAGGIGSIGRTTGGVNIPAQCWKAIYLDGQWRCYIFDNDPSSKAHPVDRWQVSKTEFISKTGLRL